MYNVCAHNSVSIFTCGCLSNVLKHKILPSVIYGKKINPPCGWFCFWSQLSVWFASKFKSKPGHWSKEIRTLGAIKSLGYNNNKVSRVYYTAICEDTTDQWPQRKQRFWFDYKDLEVTVTINTIYCLYSWENSNS